MNLPRAARTLLVLALTVLVGTAPPTGAAGPSQGTEILFQGGEPFDAVIAFSKTGPPSGEALQGYGNWSRVGPKHVDQLPLASQKKMGPILRTRQPIAKNLESRTAF